MLVTMLHLGSARLPAPEQNARHPSPKQPEDQPQTITRGRHGSVGCKWKPAGPGQASTMQGGGHSHASVAMHTWEGPRAELLIKGLPEQQHLTSPTRGAQYQRGFPQAQGKNQKRAGSNGSNQRRSPDNAQQREPSGDNGEV